MKKEKGIIKKDRKKKERKHTNPSTGLLLSQISQVNFRADRCASLKQAGKKGLRCSIKGIVFSRIHSLHGFRGKCYRKGKMCVVVVLLGGGGLVKWPAIFYALYY